jgi:chromosome segregation protein
MERSRTLEARHTAEAERERAAAIALETEEAQLEVLRQGLYEREAALEAARNRLSELTLAVDRHQGRSGYCKQQIGETDVRAQEAEREEQELVARVAPLTETLAARRAEQTQLQESLRAAETEVGAAEQAVAEAAAALAAAEARQERGREAQVTLLGRIAALSNSKAAVSGNAERAEADLAKLSGETAELERERAAATAAREKAHARGGVAQAQAAELTNRREAASARADAARAQAEQVARDVETLQSEFSELAGRRASLEEMVATHSVFDAGVRALLDRPEGLGVVGVVADAVEASSEHERAVEAFLGDRLQAVIVPDSETALRGIRWLQAQSAGRGAFLPLASARTRSDCGPLREIAGQEPLALGLLSDFYRVSGPHEGRIRASLPDAIVVKTLENALELASRQGPVSVVTLEGETLRGAMVEGGRSVKGLLAPKREVKEVAARQEELEAKLVALRSESAQAVGLATAAAAEARDLEEQIHATEKELVAARHEMQAADDEAARLHRKGVVLDAECSQAEQERAASAQKLAEIEASLQAAELERAEGSRLLAEHVAAVASGRTGAEAAQARHAEARSGLAALRERAAAAQNDCRRLEADLAELEQRIGATRARAAETAARRGELTAELAEVERLLAESLLGRDQLSSEATVAEERVRESRSGIESRELGLKERRRERDILKDALAEVDVERARTGSDLDHLARECQQAVALSAADAAAALGEADMAVEQAALEADVTELRDKLARMGEVNVLAVEQAQEHEERHAFLTAQRQDLLDSIAELDSAIRKIDKASRERFQEAFQVINQHFGETFKQLFGGGTAGLSLLDEEDLLESGIDIMAQPPGKRLQNVMLLSGGEKALTAISLLFAIFQYKPSPFCILDEVDAPLDDANIGRFVKMLDGLKEQTQFVLITHSRKTMSIADQLYGVTMEEPGVSKLVSVRFT